MAQEFAIVAPTTEEMTRAAAVGGGAFVAGGVEGVIISMIPKLGIVGVPLEWGALLGIPVVGAALALMAPKGILSDVGLGIAAGGLGYLGATIPTIVEEFTVRRAPRGGGQLGAGPGVKLLGAGSGAPQRAQQAGARVGLEF